MTAEIQQSSWRESTGNDPQLGPAGGWAPAPVVDMNTRPRAKSAWPTSATLVLLGAFVLGMSDRGLSASLQLERYFDTLLHRPVAVVPERPDVVLISQEEADRRGVLLTLAPRGFNVRVAENSARGVDELLVHTGQIGLVVVDGELPGAARLERQARALCPEARTLVLKGARDTAQVAASVYHR